MKPPLPLPACPHCGARTSERATPAGQVRYCSRCRAEEASEPLRPRPEAHEFGSVRAALRYLAETDARLSSCPAVLPEPDRVMGGVGSSRPERLALVGWVRRCLPVRVTLPDGTTREGEWIASVLCAWAVQASRPGWWTQAAAVLGTSEQRAGRVLAGWADETRDALRRAGLMPPATGGEGGDVPRAENILRGWEEIGDVLGMCERKVRELWRESDTMPVRYLGRVPYADRTALLGWFATHTSAPREKEAM